MAKRKGISHEEKLINALKKLPNPLEDKKHRIYVHFVGINIEGLAESIIKEGKTAYKDAINADDLDW